MITKKQAYIPKTACVFLDEKRKQLAIVRKKTANFGIDPNEIGIFSQERYRLIRELNRLIISKLNLR